jgi:hypothetical protein
MWCSRRSWSARATCCCAWPRIAPACRSARWLLDLCYREQAPSFRLDAEFWRRQRPEGVHRRQYLTTILEGLARWSPDAALDWLADQEWDRDLAMALAYLTPTLVRIPLFDEAFEQMRPRLQSQVVSAVQGFQDVLAGRALMEPFLRYIEAVQREREATRQDGVVAMVDDRDYWDEDLEARVGAGLAALAAEAA